MQPPCSRIPHALFRTALVFASFILLFADVGQAEAVNRTRDAELTQAYRLAPADLRGQASHFVKRQRSAPANLEAFQLLAQRITPRRRSGSGRRSGGPGLIIRINPGKLISGANKRKKRRTTTRHIKPKRRKTRRASISARQGRPAPRTALPMFRANEILVLLDQRQPRRVDSDLARIYRLVLLERLPLGRLQGRVLRYRIRGRRSVESVIIQVRANSGVLLVQKNYLYRFGGKARGRKRRKLQYALDKLGVRNAHGMSTGRGVVIAIIDSGIDKNHPDLKGAVVHAYNAVTDTRYTVHAHGTAIAGIIGARGRIKGVAPQARLLSVRAFYTPRRGGSAETTSFILLRAFDWSLNNGARIFNLSFTGPKDALVERMLAKAHAKGSVLVAAAGNGGRKAPPAYPAAYRYVIAITATDHADRLFRHANRGKYLAVAAPGVDILVLGRNKKYGYSSGTSFAAAHISGVIALMLEQAPKADSVMLKNAILSTAHDLGPKGRDRLFGAGLADAYASLRALVQQNQQEH